MEKVYSQSYLPFLEHLGRHPKIRLGLHYSGALLEWMEARHPEFLGQLGALVKRGQVEMVGGGYYEPILISIPPRDQAEQIRRMRKYLSKHFGSAPAGAWLAERVWEPQLPGVFARAKVEYTLLDDVHFQAAGFEQEQLFGYYIAEDRGAKVKVIPGLKALRYLLPFREVGDTIDFLRGAAELHPGGMAAMGDDCEKFGAWPGTHDHVYRDGWLERFFLALEENSEWLATTPPGEYLAQHAPLGRADLPAASYTELMEWVLPTPARQKLHALQQEFGGRPDVLQFLRGGIWRGFLTKYPEVNLLHKKMLRISRKIAAARPSGAGSAKRRKINDAWKHLLRAQCNDAYWHGVFGGLYAPHLRTELWRELIQAEALLDSIGKRRGTKARWERSDFDADGLDEFHVTAPAFAALIKPQDGATIAALDFRPSSVPLINSIQRRPEASHAQLAKAGRATGSGVASIHDQVNVKEAGLEQRLRYDRWARHTFRLLVFPAQKTREDYDAVRLEESAAFAGGAYLQGKSESGSISFACEAPLDLPGMPASAARLTAAKEIKFESTSNSLIAHCSVRLRRTDSSRTPLVVQVGLETVLNFLAPNAEDRYFEVSEGGGTRKLMLGWGGEAEGPSMRVVDEWQNVAVSIESPGAVRYWIAPIETVSESEEGFERVYQGSQILSVWNAELGPSGEWSGEVTLRVTKAHR
jgi:alpha-amylase